MNDEDFFDRFIRILENVQKQYDLDNLHDALILWWGMNYLFLEPDEVIERIVNDKQGESVDSILIDNRNSNLIFLQAKTVKKFEGTRKNLPESDIKKTLEGIRFLLRGDYRGKITSELENLVDEYHEMDKTGNYNTIVVFLTLRREPSDYKFIENFKKDFGKIEVQIIDFDAIKNFYENEYLKRLSEPPTRISFQVKTNILRKDVPYKARVFTVKAEEIARAYNEHKENIFQQNVRYFLGIRSKSINEQIYRSSTDKDKAINFWYFNNGITMICKKIKETTSGKVINLERPQIINGAQTTYALHRAYEEGNLKDDAEILIRVIETDDKEFIECVTLYTNSQNAIRLRDLCSNDEIQIKIQKVLLESYGYFYERKRGEFEVMYPTPAQRKNILGENYRDKVISNEKAAQAFLAFYWNKPAQAKSEKKRIFVKDDYGFYYIIFNEKDDILPEKLLLSWKLLKYIEKKKKQYRKQYRELDSEKDIDNNKKMEIYKYDFILHSEYFMVNLFKDFLMNEEYNILSDREAVLKVIDLIDTEDDAIKDIYEKIKETLAEYIEKIKNTPGYYHNKFFKNEKSIGLVRNFFKDKYSFVNILE